MTDSPIYHLPRISSFCCTDVRCTSCASYSYSPVVDCEWRIALLLHRRTHCARMKMAGKYIVLHDRKTLFACVIGVAYWSVGCGDEAGKDDGYYGVAMQSGREAGCIWMHLQDLFGSRGRIRSHEDAKTTGAMSRAPSGTRRGRLPVPHFESSRPSCVRLGACCQGSSH